MKKFFLILIIFSLAFLFGCELTKKPAKGFEDEIIVVADSLEYEKIQQSLQSVFEKEILTPQPEKLFTLKRINLSQLDNNKRVKNLILAAPLNSGSKTSDYIKSVIDSSVKAKLETDSNFVVYKYDLWAKGQLVVVLSAPDMKDLNEKIIKNSENLLYAFQKESDQRLIENLYNPTYERKNIEGKFLKDYGWVIYVQADYAIAINNPKENFVWLRRSPGSDMERWIFVYWIDNATPEYLNTDSIKVIRNRLTKKFYRTTDDSSYVVIASDEFVVKEVNFNGRYALFTQGLWELNVKGMGGPFVNYFFYDEKTQRIYMLDGSIYAPKYYKRNLIQQMDVTLQSFKTKAELSKDRIEELLDAAKD
jgi:nitrate reductase NapAB chaperone NapD